MEARSALLLLSLLATLLAVLLGSLCRRASHNQRGRSRTLGTGCEPTQGKHFRPKPPWVRREVIRLKALMPHAGCRTIAFVFNDLWQERRRMTVGKSFVANVIQNHQEAILRTRRELKHRSPKPSPKNITWALDLTFTDSHVAKPRSTLGLLDHGTRACLALRKLPTKATINILRALVDAIETFGRPKNLRTDNEAVFTSRLFRFTLWLLDIRHQRSTPHCPWQNGRIERFFGTFKTMLRVAKAESGDVTLDTRHLDEFRAWYNGLRPHQHLDGRTPFEAWTKTERSQQGKPRLVAFWGGVLVGYWRPK